MNAETIMAAALIVSASYSYVNQSAEFKISHYEQKEENFLDNLHCAQYNSTKANEEFIKILL